MKRLTLFLVMFAGSVTAVFSQETPPSDVPLSGTIETVEVSGVSEDRLGPQLLGELRGLQGQVYDPAVAGRFADRIQEELADHVAAARTIPGTQAGRVRLVFVVARASERDTLGENINQRYPIESVKLEGVSQAEISPSLWDQMQRMVGQPLDDKEAERLLQSMQTELGRRYIVRRKVQRAEVSKQLTVVYEAEKLPMIQWDHPPMIFAYHSKQGFTAFPIVDFVNDTFGTFRLGFGSNGESLVERFKGVFVEYDKPDLGTERLGFRVQAGTYGILWKPASLEAAGQLPAGPGTYRSRNFVEPAIAFALSPDLFVTAGMNNTELSMQLPAIENRSNRFGVGSINFRRDFSAVASERQQRDLSASYEIHTGGGALDSDFVYTRHYWNGRYIQRQGGAMLRLEVRGGRISGKAPVYERFMIGNAETARGWNKFDIAPLGADRMVHGSIEIGTSEIRGFYDTGSVWDPTQAILFRHSVGVTIGGGDRTGFGFLSIGFALRGSDIEPNFMIRVGGR